jgi:hypothetical protein
MPAENFDAFVLAAPVATTPLSGSEPIPCVQGGVTKQTTPAAISVMLTTVTRLTTASFVTAGSVPLTIVPPSGRQINPISITIKTVFNTTANTGGTATLSLNGVSVAANFAGNELYWLDETTTAVWQFHFSTIGGFNVDESAVPLMLNLAVPLVSQGDTQWIITANYTMDYTT